MNARRLHTAWLSILPLLLLPVAGAGAIAAVNPVFGYSVDLPVGWQQAENSDAYHIGFLSPNSDAMIQILALDPATGTDGSEIARYMMDQTQASGDLDEFRYLGASAALADISFTTGGLPVRGYLVSLDSREADFAIMAFAPVESYDAAHDHLLSAIDSFSITEEARLLPGPISQYLYPVEVAALVPALPGVRGGSGGTAPVIPGDDAGLQLLGQALPFSSSAELDGAAASLVDREARILAPYGALDRESFSQAWRRYFRMIYRDNYVRLGRLADSVGRVLRQEGVPRVDIPGEILSWLQDFTYTRTGGLSDFQPPVVCLTSQSGDCDSLGMTYVILLHHLGFDAILMASDRYAHALAAVDVEGPGARFSFEGRDWLVAELTAPVELGQIAAEMADPAGWLGVRLRLSEL